MEKWRELSVLLADLKFVKSQYGSNALEKDLIWQHITKLQSQVSAWQLNISQ